MPAFRAALEEWLIDGRPVDSVLETAMRKLFERYDLPPYEFHARIAGFEVDFWIIGTPIVLECDGWEFHAKTRAQQEADAARDAHLAEHGHVTAALHVPPDRPPARRAGPADPRHHPAVGPGPRTGRARSRDLGRSAPRTPFETIRAQMSGRGGRHFGGMRMPPSTRIVSALR